MGVQLKVDDQSLPAIAQWLMGGVPDFSSGGNAQPPSSQSMSAQPGNYVMAPDASGNPAPAPENIGPGEVIPPAKTKLQGLQELLSQGSQPPVPVPQPDLSAGASPNAMPPSDLATSQLPEQAKIDPTFQERHPTLMKLLGAGLTLGEGAAAGAGQPSFGAGFENAEMLPIQRMLAGQKVAEGNADIGLKRAQTQQLTDNVAVQGPNGTYFYIPKKDVAKYLGTAVTEKGRNDRNQANIDSRESIAGDKNAIALRKQGLRVNTDTGKTEPIPYAELSDSEQATLDLKHAQEDAASAKADLDKARNDPNSPAYKAAYGRLQVAQQNANTAAKRLGLQELKYKGDYLGLGQDDQPLPGVPVDNANNPIGLKTANITKPTNSTRSKAEQAQIVEMQGNDLLRQIDANPDMFGVVAGRWNEFNAGKFGNASPEVRDAYTSLKSFAALQPALHGSRGVGMQHEFEDAVGSMAQNPEALKASIRSLMRTAGNFEKVGTMKTAKKGSTPPGTASTQSSNKIQFVPLSPSK